MYEFNKAPTFNSHGLFEYNFTVRSIARVLDPNHWRSFVTYQMCDNFFSILINTAQRLGSFATYMIVRN